MKNRYRNNWKKYPDAAELARVKVRLINEDERTEWNELVDKHHYLNSRLVGPRLLYVAELDGKWIALMSIGQASIHLEDRDKHIGWNDTQRGRRLKFIGQNNRLVVLADTNRYPNLISRVMKLLTKRVSNDWQKHHGNPLFGLETFVDREYFQGTCYKASGWTALGQTKGFGRVRKDYYEEHNRPKEIYFKELSRSNMKLLSRNKLPEHLQCFETNYRICDVAAPDIRSLFDQFTKIRDPRSVNGRRYSLQTMLTIIALATLSGMKGTRAIASFAFYLTPNQKRILRCPKYKGEYQAPGETCIRNFLYLVSPEEVETVLGQWMELKDPAQRPNIAIDGKTVKGTARRDKDGNKIEQLHLVMAVTHDGRMIMQEAVDKKENEIIAASKLISRMPPLNGVVITGDAMNTQQKLSQQIVGKKGGTISGG
ncbi:MAG TPA: ISAs1 family transposase [Alphaproteobacteria bacterium]|nr:ISAs1 family transposase [Alphaproteobacteria bacterium]